MNIKSVYILTICVFCLLIWILIYSAQFKEYDENYAYLISAFIISLLVNSVIIFGWFKKRKFFQDIKFFNLMFLIISSPIIVGIVIVYYESIFGILNK